MDEMETLKIKIGPHEFEATGSAQSVHQKFEAFQEMVKFLASSAAADALQSTKKAMEILDEAVATKDQLPNIMRLDGREISLTARPPTLNDAILLLVLGQKMLRENDAVTGADIISGLDTTGGYSFKRIDGILEKIARDGDLLIFGERRGKKYRLTNTGLAKAKAIAAALISSVT